MARAAGFSAVVDLSDVYRRDRARASWRSRPNDYHPNADGHARLARRLDDALQPTARSLRLSDPQAERGESGDRP